MDREVGEVDGFCRLLRRSLAAPADQQLAEAPAHEVRVGMEAGQTFLRIERREHLQELGGLGPRPG